jgi:hypothetical protein
MLDLSSTERECLQLHFPCNQILNADHWEETLHKVAPQHFSTYMQFRGGLLNAFRDYHLPVIQLSKDTSKEAVCLVFEKVNTGGVQLSVFELITASYAADNFNLRDDWYGSSVRQVASRKARLAQDPLFSGHRSHRFFAGDYHDSHARTQTHGYCAWQNRQGCVPSQCQTSRRARFAVIGMATMGRCSRDGLSGGG